MNDLPTHTCRATPAGPRAAQTVRRGLALVAMAAVLGCEGPGPTEIADVGPAIEAPTMQAVEGQTTGARMLLYGPNNESQALFVEGGLTSNSPFEPEDIDFQPMLASPIDLEIFLGYDCTLVWTNGLAVSPVAHGDRLREYADEGGRVILATFVYSSNPDFRLQGGIMASGYSPFVNTGTSLPSGGRSLDFTTALTDHPILANVVDFDYAAITAYGEVTLDPGALQVASDEVGVPLVGISASQRVVGVNVALGSSFSKSGGVFRTLANACTAQSAVEVSVDIKPGANPNSINTRSAGIVPVAILGTAEFDVTDVDVTTLTFGPSGASPAHDLTVPATWADHLQDVNSDGITDLVAHYRQDETGLEEGAEEGCVAGELTDGTSIEGCDAVRILEAGVSADRRRGPS